MELGFPFPSEWKKTEKELDESVELVANVGYKIFGLGGLGPCLSTIAYCLPNYDDIRQTIGSKQVMYKLPEPIEVERYKKIYLSPIEQEIYQKYSPDLKLESVIKDLTTTLHETIGHASGKNAPGVTNNSKRDSAGKWLNGLEEMRAEILALYCCNLLL